MRRLLLVVAAVVVVDTMLFAALTPLLPDYAEDFGLSKAGAGLLVASYAFGVLLGAVPAGLLAARVGPKRAALAGILVVGAASIGFALADSAWALGLSRFAQGLGSALSWAGGLAWLIAAVPRNRRGEMLGTALGAAIFGALLGPVLGGVASLVGTRPAFIGVAVISVAVVVLGARVPGAEREAPSLGALRRAFRDQRFLGGLWLMVLAALLFGMMAVLASLKLDELGWSAVGIGALFFCSAGLEAALNPFIGRVADRRGALAPLRIALPVGIAVALALGWVERAPLLAALVLVAAVSWGTYFTPGLALLSEGADHVGLALTLAYGVMNGAWAVGAMTGPALGGFLGETVGDPLAYGLGALACAVTLLGVLRASQRVGTLGARVPEHP
jgi:MFS family permease